MIELFDDRLDITNPGGLPKGLPPEKFGKLSIARNPTIASLLLRCGYIEKMGTGIHRIQKSLREANLPEARFDYSSVFTLTFPRIISEPTQSEEKTPVETPVKTPVKILEALKQDPNLTLSEVAAKIGKSVSATERATAKLVKEGRLKRIGPQKGGHWDVIDHG